MNCLYRIYISDSSPESLFLQSMYNSDYIFAGFYSKQTGTLSVIDLLCGRYENQDYDNFLKTLTNPIVYTVSSNRSDIILKGNFFEAVSYLRGGKHPIFDIFNAENLKVPEGATVQRITNTPERTFHIIGDTFHHICEEIHKNPKKMAVLFKKTFLEDSGANVMIIALVRQLRKGNAKINLFDFYRMLERIVRQPLSNDLPDEEGDRFIQLITEDNEGETEISSSS